jgi:D-alanine-D-alanine ligase
MRNRVSDPKVFGKVAVLMGGWSSEREVSLWSGQGITAALQRRGVDAVGVDADRDVILKLRAQGYDRVFNILHGGAGEDGTVQAVLNLQGIPYTGSGVLACALGMDKLRSKRMWKAEGLPTPDWLWLRNEADALRAGDLLGYPLFTKPSEEGSSVGVTKVRGADALVTAYREAAGANRLQPRAVLAERYIAGGEYTCALLDGQPLPLIRIEPASDFYDYHAKYIANDTRYVCPTDLVPTHEAELQALCLRAYELVGCRGWARVDFMLDAKGNPWLIEVNTNPGMTSHSLVPMAAAACGMDYDALCWAILETTLEPSPNAAQEPTR